MRKLLYIMLAILFLSSCATKKQVEYIERLVEVHDTLRDSIKDSVYVHDSVSVQIKGDTVKIEHWHTKYKDKIQWRYKTVEKTDTLVKYKTVEKEVVKYPKSYWYAIGISIIFIIFVIAKIKKRWLS